MVTINQQGQLTLDQTLTIDKNSRVEVIILAPELEAINEYTQASVLEDFSQAWDEAMTGKTIPTPNSGKTLVLKLIPGNYCLTV